MVRKGIGGGTIGGDGGSDTDTGSDEPDSGSDEEDATQTSPPDDIDQIPGYAGGGGDPSPDPDPQPDPSPPDNIDQIPGYAGGGGDPSPDPDPAFDAGADDPAQIPGDPGFDGTDPGRDPGRDQSPPRGQPLPDGPGGRPGPDQDPPRGQPTPPDAGEDDVRPETRDLFLDRMDDPDRGTIDPGLEEDPGRVEAIDDEYQFEGTTAEAYVSQHRAELREAGYEPDEFSIRFSEDEGIYVEYDEELIEARDRDAVRQDTASELDAYGAGDIGVREVERDGETRYEPYVTDQAHDDLVAEQLAEQERDIATELGVAPSEVDASMEWDRAEDVRGMVTGGDPTQQVVTDLSPEAERAAIADLEEEQLAEQERDIATELGVSPSEVDVSAEWDRSEGVRGMVTGGDPTEQVVTDLSPEAEREIIAEREGIDPADLERDPETGAYTYTTTQVQREKGGLTAPGAVGAVGGVLESAGVLDEEDVDLAVSGTEDIQDLLISRENRAVARGEEIAGELRGYGQEAIDTAQDVYGEAQDVYDTFVLYEDDEVLTGTPPGIGPGGATGTARTATRTPGLLDDVSRVGGRAIDVASDTRNIVAGTGIAGGFVVGSQQDGTEEETITEDVVYERPEIDVPDQPVGWETGEVPVPEQDVGITAPEIGVPAGEAVRGTAELPIPETYEAYDRAEVPVPEQTDQVDPTQIQVGQFVDPALTEEPEPTREPTTIEREFGEEPVRDRYREDIEEFQPFDPTPTRREIIRDTPQREYAYERDIDPRVVVPETPAMATQPLQFEEVTRPTFATQQIGQPQTPGLFGYTAERIDNRTGPIVSPEPGVRAGTEPMWRDAVRPWEATDAGQVTDTALEYGQATAQVDATATQAQMAQPLAFAQPEVVQPQQTMYQYEQAAQSDRPRWLDLPDGDEEEWRPGQFGVEEDAVVTPTGILGIEDVLAQSGVGASLEGGLPDWNPGGNAPEMGFEEPDIDWEEWP